MMYSAIDGKASKIRSMRNIYDALNIIHSSNGWANYVGTANTDKKRVIANSAINKSIKIRLI